MSLRGMPLCHIANPGIILPLYRTENHNTEAPCNELKIFGTKIMNETPKNLTRGGGLVNTRIL